MSKPEPFFHPMQYAEIAIENEHRCVTILHYAHPKDGHHFRSGWLMSADQAREIAAKLIEAADLLEKNPAPRRH